MVSRIYTITGEKGSTKKYIWLKYAVPVNNNFKKAGLTAKKASEDCKSLFFNANLC